MNLSQTDYLLAQVAYRCTGLMQLFGDLETRSLQKRLEAIAVDRPVFIAGLARAGTTILLEQLSKVPGVATHRYRDFPFVMTPRAWNWFQDCFRRDHSPVERPHRDRIQITSESPEAFEEPIWQFFFPHVHSLAHLHRLTGTPPHAEFEQFFRDHVRKILWLRHGHRYVSKGNYNICRIEYLARMFPDARFIVPVRHPATHVHSLVAQHQLFCDYSTADARVPNYLRMAGHYEFGPQRCPIRLTEEGGRRQALAWESGDEYLGYAIQWREVYQFLHQIRQSNEALAKQILVFRYEDFCDKPQVALHRALTHAELPLDSTSLESLAGIQGTIRPVPDEIREKVWSETMEVAADYGYASR